MKEVIEISPTDTLTFNRYNQNWIINDKESYDSDKYIISIDRTIKAKTESVKANKTSNNSLESEMNHLKTITNLRNKLLTLDNLISKAKCTTDEDKFILLGRSITKAKEIINKYIDSLKQSGIFFYDLSENFDSLTLILAGNYAQCKRTIPLINRLTEGVNL